MQTQVRGERYDPPTSRTAVGAADFAERAVVIALKSSIEAEYFTRMYRKMGWRTLTANRKGKFLDLVRLDLVDLVVTDRFRYVAAFRSVRRDGRVPPLHFVANDATNASVLFEAGAEAIMVRTIRHDDFFSYDVVQRTD